MLYLTPYTQRLDCYHTLMREDVWKLHLFAGGDRTALKDLVVSWGYRTKFTGEENMALNEEETSLSSMLAIVCPAGK